MTKENLLVTREPVQAGAIVRSARSWLGTPYLHQASRKGAGCDCLGLVRGVWREVIGDEPEKAPAYSNTWAETGAPEKMLEIARRYFTQVESDRVRAGNLLVFRMRRRAVAKHVGIATNYDNFIHAYDGNCVVENTLSHFWRSRIVGVFQFPKSGEPD